MHIADGGYLFYMSVKLVLNSWLLKLRLHKNITEKFNKLFPTDGYEYYIIVL